VKKGLVSPSPENATDGNLGDKTSESDRKSLLGLPEVLMESFLKLGNKVFPSISLAIRVYKWGDIAGADEDPLLTGRKSKTRTLDA
jgi:hypothetical protein